MHEWLASSIFMSGRRYWFAESVVKHLSACLLAYNRQIVEALDHPEVKIGDWVVPEPPPPDGVLPEEQEIKYDA